MSIPQYKTLIYSTKQILKHQEEKEILKGERFNIFSILRMETKENATHSAFLAELLNPNGSHLKGNIFLELFLKTINNNTIDLSSAKVKCEHHIGIVDYEKREGGRIDIYIWDKKGNCISIENKIHAGDQQAQIERYCKYNSEKNNVYYLTLNGDEPSDDSKGSLKCGEHFYAISYSSDIIDWLTLCMKEASDSPIIRESIKQYIILLKKLTYTMNNEEEQELLEVIVNNYEASIFLVNNINRTIANFNEKIRASILKALVEKISDRYIVENGTRTDTKYSQIWIRIKGYETDKIFFGIQNFSVNVDPFFGKGLIVGIFVNNGVELEEYKNLGTKNSNWWYANDRFKNFNDFEIDLQNPKLLSKLIMNKDFYNGFVEQIVAETIDYLEIHTDDVIPFLKPI